MPTGDSENSKSPREYYSQEIQKGELKGEGTRKVEVWRNTAICLSLLSCS